MMSNNTNKTSDDSIRVQLVVPDAESFMKLTVALDEIEGDVRMSSVSWGDAPEESSVDVDLNALTDKQRETVVLGLEMGYYSMPRKSTIGDIADRLDVSESAISQRLRRAECRLVHAIFDEMST